MFLIQDVLVSRPPMSLVTYGIEKYLGIEPQIAKTQATTANCARISNAQDKTWQSQHQ